MNRKSKLVIVLLLVSGYFLGMNASNLPRSREGKLIESVSPTEILIRAKGIGYWEKGMSKKGDMDNFLNNSAEEDARKAAIYFVLFSGTDPLLRTDNEKCDFSNIQEKFFDSINIREFITWEDSEFDSRVKKTIKKKKKYELHIGKSFKVSKQAIMDYLVKNDVIVSREVLSENIGLPFIMVIPKSVMGKLPLDLLRLNPDLSHAAKVIESYLTARQYDVLVPGQQVELNELAAAQLSLQDVEEDYSYQLALSIGSDIYITYEVNIEGDKYDTKKAIVSVRAYETTTARLLGTETGYSPSADVAVKVLIENAINDAIDKVLSRLTAYWKEDMNRGIQYKMIVSISNDFDKEEAEEISFAFGDALDALTKNKRYKENIVTRSTLDYLLWCDPEIYSKSTKLYKNLKKSLNREYPEGVLNQVNINRKMLILTFDSE